MRSCGFALICFLCGLLGMLAFTVCRIAYEDHQRVEQIWTFLTAPKPAPVMTPPPEPGKK